MSKPLRFRAECYGYDYTWEVLPPGLQVDVDLQPFVWARPVERHPGRKRGWLRGNHIFHLSSLRPELIEFFRARAMRTNQQS